MTAERKTTQSYANDSATSSPTNTGLAQSGSRPVLYELVSYRGEIFGPYTSIKEAAEVAEAKWPADRTGAGYDIQVAGAR